jgi:hypothetical protein
MRLAKRAPDWVNRCVMRTLSRRKHQHVGMIVNFTASSARVEVNVLASLLPGLREVRAPLAAGFVWLVALWFLLEPRWPRGDDAGIVGSAARLMDMLNLLGQGVVLSFAAYLLGSFSMFIFSAPLLRLIQMSGDGVQHRYLSGLSELARLSLEQVAADERQHLEEVLSLSGEGVDEVLGLSAPVGPVPVAEDKIYLVRKGRRAKPYAGLLHSGTTQPNPEERQHKVIAARVLRDLPVVANAQLLGKEPEVFSAVDRSQAEVEFRVAMVPALAALSLSVSVAALPERRFLSVVAVVLGVLAAAALMLDAARHRRDSNELVLSLMEHGRIRAPSAARAESKAVAIADRAPAKVLAKQFDTTKRAILKYLDKLQMVPSSGTFPMLEEAHDASRRAREQGDRLEGLLRLYETGTDDQQTVDSVLVPLDRALSGWQTINAGISVPEPAVPEMEWSFGSPSPEELVALLAEGREQFDGLVERVQAVISAIVAQDAAGVAVPADDTVASAGADSAGGPAQGKDGSR